MNDLEYWRELAEETRQSTEKIASIVDELNQNAQVATDIVKQSIGAMDTQNEKVADASDGFGEVQKHIIQDDIKKEQVTGSWSDLLLCYTSVLAHW